MERFNFFPSEADKEFELSIIRKYIEDKHEIDKFLESKIAPFIFNKSLDILDACCGIGHIPFYLSDISPQSGFTGIDQADFMIAEAKRICAIKRNIAFEVADIFDYAPLHRKCFDISISWKTLSWVPYYEEMVKALIDMTKQHIFISALFCDDDIDFEIKVWQYGKKPTEHCFYNVYSLPKFTKYAESLGAQVVSESFDISIDIPKVTDDRMGTYTEKLESGKRLQISGAVLMLWKLIRLDL